MFKKRTHLYLYLFTHVCKYVHALACRHEREYYVITYAAVHLNVSIQKNNHMCLCGGTRLGVANFSSYIHWNGADLAAGGTKATDKV